MKSQRKLDLDGSDLIALFGLLLALLGAYLVAGLAGVGGVLLIVGLLLMLAVPLLQARRASAPGHQPHQA